MARKTFCDRCGTECVNFVGRITGFVVHTTAQGEVVGEDHFESQDVGSCCWDAVATFLGLKLTAPSDPPETAAPPSREILRAHP